MSAFESFQEDVCTEVEVALAAWVPDEQRAGALAGAMRHIALSGGKRLRPTLVALGALDGGGRRDDALPAAVAVELVHAYSLLHDDLPCMDDGQLRRGKPCAHLVYGEAMAVLAGDGLLTLAFEVLARHTPPGRDIAAMVSALAVAAGWEGMVGGQVADLAAEGCEPDVRRVATIHAGKTAAMIAVSLQLGALSAGADREHGERLARAGHELGMAFQIVDDLLDLESTTEALGKAAGADAERDKMTWPAAVGAEQARVDARRMVDAAVAALAPGPAGELARELGEMILSRAS